MPVLDARALNRDPIGVAFLRAILLRNVTVTGTSQIPTARQPVPFRAPKSAKRPADLAADNP